MTKPKILIVDDDEAVLDFLQAKIGARFDLVSTNAPENVMPLARREQPDLIVCDFDMPGMDGSDVSAALFDDQETRRIPLLFLTGLAMPADIKRLNGQMAGRAAMSKSAPIDQLIARIETLIAVS
jgi:CheY-like chemotaxis protein